jgi:hypothetical protein
MNLPAGLHSSLSSRSVSSWWRSCSSWPSWWRRPSSLPSTALPRWTVWWRRPFWPQRTSTPSCSPWLVAYEFPFHAATSAVFLASIRSRAALGSPLLPCVSPSPIPRRFTHRAKHVPGRRHQNWPVGQRTRIRRAARIRVPTHWILLAERPSGRVPGRVPHASRPQGRAQTLRAPTRRGSALLGDIYRWTGQSRGSHVSRRPRLRPYGSASPFGSSTSRPARWNALAARASRWTSRRVSSRSAFAGKPSRFASSATVTGSWGSATNPTLEAARLAGQ